MKTAGIPTALPVIALSSLLGLQAFGVFMESGLFAARLYVYTVITHLI